MRIKAYLASCAALVLSGAISPLSAAPPLAVYGQLPGFERAAISPSGDHVAVIGTLHGVRRLLVLDAQQKLVTQADVGSAKIRAIDWAGDQSVLVRSTATVTLDNDFTVNRAELSSVLVVPLGGAKPWRVFAANADAITGGVFGMYGIQQRGGRWYGYFAGLTLPDVQTSIGADRSTWSTDLYEVDLQSQIAKPITRHLDIGGTYRDWLVDQTGTVGATLETANRFGTWRLYNGHHIAVATGTDPTGRIHLVAFTPDGNGVIYGLRDAKDGQDRWFSVPLAGGTPQPFLDHETIDATFEDHGHRLIGYSHDDAQGGTHFFDPHQDKVAQAIGRAFPGERLTLVGYNDAFDRLLIKTEGPGDPITWGLVDLHTGQTAMLGQAYPMDAGDVGATRMVAYTAADGLKMDGVLTMPPGGATRNLPAVILPHGGPTAHDHLGFDWLAQAFASRGYAVFQPNFRGSTGYGTAFETAGDGEWGRKMQSDLSDGLGELVHQGIVDPKRVCIVGASYGGYAALAGVTLQQGVYACAVSVAGLSDLGRMVSDDIADSGRDEMLMRNLKSMIGSGHDLKAISPITHAVNVAVPVMLIHGKDDTVVPFSQSTNMADALRHAGKAVEFVTLPGEDHWLSKSETRLMMLEAAVGFVTKHNPPDPAK